MSTTTTQRTNRYPGSCARCGAKVPAESGHYFKNEPVPGFGDSPICGGAVVHVTEDDCKKTTKTWHKFESQRRHNAYIAALDAVWSAHGMRRPTLEYVDHPMRGGGNGVSVVLGNNPDEPQPTFQRHSTVMVFSGSTMLGHRTPEYANTGDYHADGVANEQAKVDAVLEILG